MVTQALGFTKEMDEVLRWLLGQMRDPKVSAKERRLCAAEFARHMREMARVHGEDAAVNAGARVLVIAPDQLRSILGQRDGADAVMDALQALAAPAREPESRNGHA